MKLKMLGLLLSSMFSLIACNENNYQNSKLNLSPKLDRRNVLAGTTNDNTFYENIQIFLNKYIVLKDAGINQDTLVDYRKLFNEKDQKGTLELRQNLYTQIAKLDYKTFSKDEKTAFLINTYNFLAIETVIANFVTEGIELESITHIGPFEFWAFGNLPYLVAGEQKTLDQIEKETLKPLLTFENGNLDARFHFAVICAAKGCPILLKDAYTPENINDQLDTATIEGLKVLRNFDTTQGGLKLTELFSWYVDDFEKHAISNSEVASGDIREFLRRYVPLADLSGEVSFTTYDWNLNIITNSLNKGER
jgi:hypothetical protein